MGRGEEILDLNNGSPEFQTANEEDSSAHDVHLLDLLIILSKRRKFILRFTLGAVIASVITVLLVPNSYTAETVVLPPGQNSSMSFRADSGKSPYCSADSLSAT